MKSLSKGFPRQSKTAWLMSMPAILLILTFLIIPFMMAVGFSFTNQRLISNPNVPTRFIGFQNYIRLTHNRDFLTSMINCLKFAAIVVPVQTTLALFMAILINKRVKFVNIFRTIYFSPVVITMVVVSIVWSLLFNPTGGFINEFLKFISGGLIPAQGWLKDPNMALPSIIILSVWQGAGFQMVLFLAGIQDIPEELYEAADIDGANKIQQFFNVTIPQLRNTLLFVIISTTILAFKLFTQVWVLTKGGPQNATITPVVLIYKEGFVKLNVGYASAIAVVFFITVLFISLIQRKIIKNEEEAI